MRLFGKSNLHKSIQMRILRCDSVDPAARVDAAQVGLMAGREPVGQVGPLRRVLMVVVLRVARAGRPPPGVGVEEGVGDLGVPPLSLKPVVTTNWL